jgi:hypothetical protein
MSRVAHLLVHCIFNLEAKTKHDSRGKHVSRKKLLDMVTHAKNSSSKITFSEFPQKLRI